jgi:hypothetical protein
MSATGRPEREYRSAQRGRSPIGTPSRPEDVHASGAKPRREARVRERGWRPTRWCDRYVPACNEAANTGARSAKVLR